MLMPKKTKWRKDHKRSRGGKATRNIKISFGSYGLKSLTACWVTSRQIEAARKVMTKYTAKGGQIWIRIFPDKPVTAHGGEIPMGKGKGAVDYYVAIVKPGTIMFEMGGVTKEIADKAMNLAAHKLPVKCLFISKD
ncbi:50S ribosomal protein L16 [Candidatus Falkowbacteria bacterium]|uniref:Large ribosomal subunit protein uL16 n=1 Tax=Candidatus Falkowbacteria bacterium CG10_big_fil_rev_8_21_14_0_10_37_18 TaxID=1974562 RepID=A0A2H0V8W6_9BACT|nr:50S ribosomal protein L16 [Candidatus Falkowbacteria bacterium]NCQ12539.1 50S ribosomal protein L16 [Candidatus Falkowbacteria bacterium]OIO06003.1 MAG: 50S ribosomal protein L16 [Candidatus Falkowbacteria bacterium CG1_02_37_21]PIR95525.1 MAG: 50S ribosomal protein L16 [Candidatus Falkowbacteria bacterium CG10_big_fil_rev_8_21_14_0_10_37_18]